MTAVDSRPVAPAEPLPDNRRGILAMLAGMACFVMSDTMMKLAGAEVPVGEIMFIRGAIATLLILVLARISGQLPGLTETLTGPHRWGLIWRTAAEVGAAFCFISGLLSLAFTDAAAIGQFTPLAITAGAAIFLGEPVGWRRWLATITGLVGVLLIIKPGTTAFQWPALWIVGTVLCVTARDLVTRRLGTALPAMHVTIPALAAVSIAGLVLAPFETWVVPSANTSALLAVSALGVIGGTYGVVVAMRSGEVSVVGPFRYAVILYALLIGWLVFGERPDGLTIAGIAIVLAAGLYTFHRERVRRADIAARAALSGERG